MKQSNNIEEKFEKQSIYSQNIPLSKQTKNKRKLSSDVYVQVLRSPSPVNSQNFPIDMFSFTNNRKVENNMFLKKTSVLPVKLSKTFSEKLSNLRAKEMTEKEKITAQRKGLSKSFMKLNGKNMSINHEIFQVSQSKGISSLSEKDFYDPYSMFYFSKRIISHDELSSYFKGKRIFLLSTLLKTVTAPSYELPDPDNDYVVIGIIAYKSIPKYIQTEKKDMDIKSRYCVLTLTDLKWEISLFLFDEAFKRYWKIQVGYIIAILNPGIMKPKNIDSGDFCLVLSHEYDSLLELGVSRDLGFCNAMKRNGKQCTAWVDIRHFEVCGFHVDQGMYKTKNSRMEIASGSQLYSPKKNKYISTRVGYSKGPKPAEGLLAEYTGWVHDPWNGNVFMVSNFSYDYERDGLDVKKTERMRNRLQKQTQESNMIKRFLAYEDVLHKTSLDSLKNKIKSVSSVSLENSSNLRPEPFSARSIKRIGFDPYSHLASESRLSTRPIEHLLSRDICYSSDSDLEII